MNGLPMTGMQPPGSMYTYASPMPMGSNFQPPPSRPPASAAVVAQVTQQMMIDGVGHDASRAQVYANAAAGSSTGATHDVRAFGLDAFESSGGMVAQTKASLSLGQNQVHQRIDYHAQNAKEMLQYQLDSVKAMLPGQHRS